MKDDLEIICSKIMDYYQTKIIFRMKYFNIIFAHVRIVRDDDVEGWTSTSDEIRYNAEWLIRNFQKDNKYPMRVLLHSLLHSVFCHALLGKGYRKEYWSLAADIVVEKILLDLHLDFAETADDFSEKNFFAELNANRVSIVTKPVYYYLIGNYPTPEHLQGITKLFCKDDHRFWYNDQTQNDESGGNGVRGAEKCQTDELTQNAIAEWKKTAERMKAEMEYDRATAAKDQLYGDQSNDLMTNLSVTAGSPIPYSQFLNVFGKYHDVMKVNLDEFDYVYYSYSMKMLNNIPIIEPLEYSENRQILDFVVAIDTSGSSFGGLVKKFLKMTYSILQKINDTKKKVRIHIIQCDAEIKSDVSITSDEEWKDFFSDFRLVGGGGTDFRPVFDYVTEKLKRGTYPRIDGLIYFTDGFGQYPAERPPFKSAFVFAREYYTPVETPEWAYKMIIDMEGENMK